MTNKTKSQRRAIAAAKRQDKALATANAEIALIQEILPPWKWVNRLMASHAYIRVIRQRPEIQSFFRDLLDMVETIAYIALERDSEQRAAMWAEYRRNNTAGDTAELFDSWFVPNFEVFQTSYESLSDEMSA